jgi:peroxiredoxin
MRRWTAWAAAAALTLAGSAASAALELGDEAPELEVTEWIQGEELQIASNPAKRVRIVQFFNSYDQGCVKAVPDLEKLHTELGPEGVDLIAVTTQAGDAAREFIEKHEPTFRLAVDQYNNTNAAYMKGIHRLPMAFVIDQENRIAWIGSPAEGMRKVVEEVLDGTYDVEKAKQVSELRNALFQTLQKQKPEEMAKAADALLEVEPTDSFARSIRLQVFEQEDDVDGYFEWMKAYVEQQKDEAEVQSWVAWRLVSRGDMAWRDPELAHQCSTRAVELSRSENADMLDTHARVLYEIGLFDEAIEAAKASLKIEEDDDVKGRLAHYEKCLALQKKLGKSSGKKKRR